MPTPLIKITEELQRQAKLCETIAADKTEESLTGEPKDKEMNERDAREWLIKSQIWLEAEAVVRANLPAETPPQF
jgi:hypothetical protein